MPHGQYYTINSSNPQVRLIKQAAQMVRDGKVIVYPTDSCYAMGCQLGDKNAVARIRQIRGVSDHHHMTLVCRDLSELSHYALVNDMQFRLLKHNTPGSYTFILKATKEVPKRLQHPNRSTIGVRIPDHNIALALLEELGEPLLSSTMILPNEESPLNDAPQIRILLEQRVDLVIDGGAVAAKPTSVIDLTGDMPMLVRAGRGDTAHFLFRN